MRVLIVDDEPKICRLIYELTEWEKLGLEFIGEAHNGAEAYECVEKNAPDIVITDIRMPEFDGLEFIRRARNVNENIKYIVISGYKEFEYIYEAMRLNVEQFLIKPINGNELNAALRKIVSVETEKTKYPFRDESGYTQRRNRFMLAVLEQSRDFGKYTIDDINNKYMYHFREALFAVITVKIERPILFKSDYQDFLARISWEISHLFSENVIETEYIFKPNGQIYYILNYDEKEKGHIKKIICNLPQFIGNRCKQEELWHYAIGISREIRTLKEIKNAWNEAELSVRTRLVLGSERCLFAEECIKKEYDDRTKYIILDAKFTEKLNEYIEYQDIEGIKELLRESYEKANDLFKDYPAMAFDMGTDIIYKMYSGFMGYHMATDDTANNHKQLIRLHENTFSLKEDWRIIIKSLSREMEEIAERMHPQQHVAISTVQQYIQKHYKENITLEILAERVYMNPIYLSALFKKETGMKYTDYILNVRINKAKQLLLQPQYSITDISEMVGINGSKYFSKLFHKVTGLRPKEYRQLGCFNLNE